MNYLKFHLFLSLSFLPLFINCTPEGISKVSRATFDMLVKDIPDISGYWKSDCIPTYKDGSTLIYLYFHKGEYLKIEDHYHDSNCNDYKEPFRSEGDYSLGPSEISGIFRISTEEINTIYEQEFSFFINKGIIVSINSLTFGPLLKEVGFPFPFDIESFDKEITFYRD